MTADKDSYKDRAFRLGLRANLSQFIILASVTAFIGSIMGLEQTVVPLIGLTEFNIESSAFLLSFIASFGFVKAFLNLFAGKLSERWNRKKVLIVGWLFGVPVPILLLIAPDWNWIIIANVFLGINQGLAGSMVINMKIDIVGKERRGLALGFNEFAGYFATGIISFVTGYLATTYGLKPYPFYLGIAFAAFGLLLSTWIVKDTKKFTRLETEQFQHENSVDDSNNKDESSKQPTFGQVFLQTTWKNHTLFAVSQAGLVNNLIFGVSWGLLTVYFSSFSLNAVDIGILKFLHPGIWGILQIVTGTLSDRVGRKILIIPGMFIQAIGIWTILYVQEYFGWVIGMGLLGVGTVMVYPTLLAAISDTVQPSWRAESLGVYRFWRDIGFVVGAIGIGFIADLFSIYTALQVVAGIAMTSGVVITLLMKESKE